MLEFKRPLCNVWRDPGQQQGFQRGRGRAGASRKLTGLGWAREGWGELQKLKAEDPPCSRPWPDLGYLPLPRNPRQTVVQEADCTERSQQGPRRPGSQGGPMPDWDRGGRNKHPRALPTCQVRSVCRAQGWEGLGASSEQPIEARTAISPHLQMRKPKSRKFSDLPQVTQSLSGRAETHSCVSGT